MAEHWIDNSDDFIDSDKNISEENWKALTDQDVILTTLFANRKTIVYIEFNH